MVSQVCKFSELKVGQCFRLHNAIRGLEGVTYRKTLNTSDSGPIVDNAVRLDKGSPAYFAGYTSVVPLEEEPTHQPLLFDEYRQAKDAFASQVERLAA